MMSLARAHTNDKLLLAGSLVLMAMVLSPVVALFMSGLASAVAGNVIESSLPALIGNTVLLAGGSALLACVWGISGAWLIETCEFRGRSLFAFLLFLPFAMPPYLMAYVYADLIDDGGWLPPGWGVRNMLGACLVMSLALYPYVYIFARASFSQRSCGLLSASRLLGCSPWRAFFKTALPLARPALAVGALLVFMEASNDIAIAEDFGLRTLGYHVYDLWLNRDARGTAVAVASLAVLLALVLAMLEVLSRERQRQYQKNIRCYCSDLTYKLAGGKQVMAQAWCAGLFGVAFAVPVLSLVSKLGGTREKAFMDAALALLDTLWLVFLVLATSFVLACAVMIVRRNLLMSKLVSQGLSRVAMAGYAFPGVIYALGFILVATALAQALEGLLGVSIHWLWTTTNCMLVMAMAARLVTISWGGLESGLGQVLPEQVAVARNANRGLLNVVWKVYLPIMRPALLAAVLLLAIDVVKELPLTLILRPFGTETLAIQLFQYAADEELRSAAPSALLMLAVTSLALFAVDRWLAPAWLKPRQ